MKCFEEFFPRKNLFALCDGKQSECDVMSYSNSLLCHWTFSHSTAWRLRQREETIFLLQLIINFPRRYASWNSSFLSSKCFLKCEKSHHSNEPRSSEVSQPSSYVCTWSSKDIRFNLMNQMFQGTSFQLRFSDEIHKIFMRRRRRRKSHWQQFTRVAFGKTRTPFNVSFHLHPRGISGNFQ